jgi:hypothetical protein
MAIPVLETDWEINDSGSGNPETDLLLPKPVGVASGDLLILIVINDDTTSTPQFADNVTGWNFVLTQGSSVPDAHIGLYWRKADGTEPSTVTVTSANANEWIGWYIRITGADTDVPIHKELSGEGASPGPHDILEVTTTLDDCLCVFGSGYDGGHGFPFSISGTGWTKTDDHQTGEEQSGDSSGLFGQRDLATAGASGDVEVTDSSGSEGASWFQIAIPPGAAPGPVGIPSLVTAPQREL